MVNKKYKYEQILAFLLGISICEGISVVFSFGSTSFTFTEVLSPLVFIILFSKKNEHFFGFLKNIPLAFKLFFLIVIFSIIPGIIYFGIEALYRYLVGIIYFFVVLTMAANVYMLKGNHSSLYKGMLWGLSLNILFSLVCYISFQAGAVISLENLFPRDNFFKPVLSFRSQGFFLEPSHFIRYFSSIVLILIANVRFKNQALKYMLIIATIMAVILSFSGSIVILSVGLLMYFLVKKNRTRKQIKISTVLIFALVVFSCIFLFLSSNILSNMEEIFTRIITGADIMDVGNAERLDGMKIISKNFDVAIIGCGWNLIGTLIETRNLGIVSAFSEILEMLIEIGFFGGLVYAFAVLSTSLNLIKEKRSEAVALGISLLIIFAIQGGTDYPFNTCTMLVFGLAICKFSDKKMMLVPNNSIKDKKM